MAQKNWLERQILSMTGLKASVQPVVVFPGWFVESKVKNPEVSVMEPKALPSFIHRQPESLAKQDIQLITNEISRYKQYQPS